jgi:nitrate reductase gamma subunit
VNTVKEALLFRSLFRGDRMLWAIAWLFHVVLALIFVGHLRVFAPADGLLLAIGLNEEQIQGMSSGVGGVAGIIILATALFLLLRRLVIPRVREITGLGDVFALLLIGAIIVTGNMMRFSPEHLDLALTRDYFAGLATFRNAAGAVVLDNNMFLLHMCLALLLIMLIPFSKILHFGGIFFTHQMIRKQ